MSGGWVDQMEIKITQPSIRKVQQSAIVTKCKDNQRQMQQSANIPNKDNAWK